MERSERQMLEVAMLLNQLGERNRKQIQTADWLEK